MAMEASESGTANLNLEANHLLFRPPSDMAWLHDSLRDIPQYLFRLSTPESDGTTNSIWVESYSVVKKRPGRQQDYFARADRAQAADEINRHLWWKPKNNDNLVSWTSSLLFVLQYAAYRNARAGDEDLTCPANIHICVVDTTRFKTGTFIQDMDLIRAFKAHSSPQPRLREDLSGLRSLRNKQHRTLSGGFYFGEYLSQGALRVHNKICSITIASLLDYNILALQPELGSNAEEWANEVIRLREPFYKNETYPLSEEQTKAVVAITEHFDPRWRLAWAANLLCLLPRSLKDKALAPCLARVLKLDDAEKLGFTPLYLPAGPEMPEVKHAHDMFSNFCLFIENNHMDRALKMFHEMMKDHQQDEELAPAPVPVEPKSLADCVRDLESLTAQFSLARLEIARSLVEDQDAEETD